LYHCSRIPPRVSALSRMTCSFTEHSLADAAAMPAGRPLLLLNHKSALFYLTSFCLQLILIPAEFSDIVEIYSELSGKYFDHLRAAEPPTCAPHSRRVRRLTPSTSLHQRVKVGIKNFALRDCLQRQIYARMPIFFAIISLRWEVLISLKRTGFSLIGL
jgi:hypothetical protein